MSLPILLVQIAVVLLVGRLLTRLIRGLGQPSVIGEILTGIALGPSLLGYVAPDLMERLFPPSSFDVLGTIANLGLVFFMFLVGLEFDPRLLEGRASSAMGISAAGVVVPLAAGAALAGGLPADLAGDKTTPLAFALFVGVAMCVTAFPVLARILTERRLVRTPVGALALAAAAVGDVIAWILLALVSGIAVSAGPASAAIALSATLLYAAVIWFVLRPALARLGPREGHEISVELTTAVVLMVVISARITEEIGVHALFGGFLVGAAMPRHGGLPVAFAEKMEDFVTVVLLPLFFAFSGLRTHIGLLHHVEDWLWTGALIAVATGGKFLGTFVAARFTGLGWRESTAIGVLMNTRGLMEIVVLNVGLDLGVISERMFAMMVIVALVTTWVTTPVLKRVYPSPGAEAAPKPVGGLLVCVSDPRIVAPLLPPSGALRRPQEPICVVHLRPVDRPRQYLREESDPSEPLRLVEEEAARLGLRVETLAFSSGDPGDDIVRVAGERAARMVLMGTHRSTFGVENLGGVTGTVLHGVPSAVGILVDRGLEAVRRVRRVGPTHEAGDAVWSHLRAGGAAEGDGIADDLLITGFSTDEPPTVEAEVSTLLVRAPTGPA